jgi:hypothetical protein
VHNFSLFKNAPLNEFHENISPLHASSTLEKIIKQGRSELIFTPDEVSRLFRFPSTPTKETSLLKINARKLALPIGMPILPYSMKDEEIVINTHPKELAIFAESDYRSVRVPIGIFDEDRLRHTYVVGKT